MNNTDCTCCHIKFTRKGLKKHYDSQLKKYGFCSNCGKILSIDYIKNSKCQKCYQWFFCPCLELTHDCLDEEMLLQVKQFLFEEIYKQKESQVESLDDLLNDSQYELEENDK